MKSKSTCNKGNEIFYSRLEGLAEGGHKTTVKLKTEIDLDVRKKAYNTKLDHRICQ